jgi:DNA-binding SARP family transcriptional activator
MEYSSAEPRIEFRVLGGLALRDGMGRDVSALLAQPKRLTLLLHLALAKPGGAPGRPELVRRDLLLALFWPELDQHHARGALRKALQFLRQTVGDEAVFTRGEEVGLNRAVVWCDAVAFVEALERHDAAEALGHYGGDLAPGLYVAGAPAVEDWLEQERARLRELAARAARELRDEREAAGRLTQAVDWGRRATALAPDDERVWRELIALLDRLGDRSGALRVYDLLLERLATEQEVEPAPETQRLVAAVRARRAQEVSASARPARGPAPAVAPGSLFTDRYLIEGEITRAGGMARVFVARDLKIDRRVAVKVLAAEPTEEGRARFLQEIRITARLSHPHILPLHDSGEVSGRLYYVMPFIEGETLRDRLERDRELPLDTALTIARQAAAALAYAHEAGVVHRDVKPENILLHDGEVLVADFGIAHAARMAADTGGSNDRLTAEGIALGTPAYMSPEQAAGIQRLDARSDVYSLAAVLYEMLVGEPPHTGPNAGAVLTRILTDPVRPVRATREAVPKHIDAALQRALARHPADRFPSAAAFARALAPDGAILPPDVVEDHFTPALKRPPRRWAPALLRALAGLALLAVAFVGGRVWRVASSGGDSERAAVRRWEIVLPDSAPLAFRGTAPLGLGRSSLAISPDGTRLVYVAQRGARTQLYLRALGGLEAVPLPGTDGAYQPFFSPDGQWIAFFAGRDLKKVPTVGGPAVTLTQVREPMGGAWASDDRILVADFQGYRPSWVPSGGGALQLIGGWAGPRLVHPEFLSAGHTGDWVLTGSNSGLIYLGSLSSGEVLVLTREGVSPPGSVDISKLLYGTNPRYLHSGHIAFFAASGTLMVLPFDAVRRRVLGPPEPVLEGVRLETPAGGSQLTISDGGTLIYAPGGNARLSNLVWVDHATGRIDTLSLPHAGYGSFALSPDGRRVMARITSVSGPAELWAIDIGRGERAHIPLEGIPGPTLKWWPDGNAALVSELGPDGSAARSVVVRQSLSGGGERDTVARGAIHFDASRRSRLLAVARFPAPGITLLPFDAPDSTLLVPTGPAAFLRFSPDGRWIAYTDWAPEKSEVEVVRIAPPDVPHTVSVDGGEEPSWTPDGRSIVYRNGDQWLAVDISTTGDFRAGPPRVVFQGPYLQVPGVSHDISADGRRQLVLLGLQEKTASRLVVVTNWFRALPRGGS